MEGFSKRGDLSPFALFPDVRLPHPQVRVPGAPDVLDRGQEVRAAVDWSHARWALRGEVSEVDGVDLLEGAWGGTVGGVGDALARGQESWASEHVVWRACGFVLGRHVSYSRSVAVRGLSEVCGGFSLEGARLVRFAVRAAAGGMERAHCLAVDGKPMFVCVVQAVRSAKEWDGAHLVDLYSFLSTFPIFSTPALR